MQDLLQRRYLCTDRRMWASCSPARVLGPLACRAALHRKVLVRACPCDLDDKLLFPCPRPHLDLRRPLTRYLVAWLQPPTAVEYFEGHDWVLERQSAIACVLTAEGDAPCGSIHAFGGEPQPVRLKWYVRCRRVTSRRWQKVALPTACEQSRSKNLICLASEVPSPRRREFSYDLLVDIARDARQESLRVNDPLDGGSTGASV